MRPASIGGFWRRLTLWPRLAIVVTAGFAALFALVSLLALRAVDDSTERILKERLVLAQVAAHELDRMLDRSTRQLAHSIREGNRGNEATDESTLSHVRVAFGALALGAYLFDGRQRLVLADRAHPLPSRHEPSWRAVRQALVTGLPAISDVFRDSSGGPAVALAVPSGDHTQARTVLVAVLDMQSPDVVGVLREATRLGDTGHGELVGPGGMVIASTEPNDYLKPGEHLTFYRKMLHSSRPGVENVPYESDNAARDPHEHHVMAFARLRTAPWGVAVGGLDTETLAPAQHLRSTLLFAGAGSLAVLWALTLLGARLLVRPVRSLTESAHKMAAGDLERPVRVSEGGEIGMLAESLETMRAQLSESLETIRNWGRSLETQVEDRTTELRARNSQLAAVTAVATAALSARDVEGVIRACLEAILRHIEVEGAAVRLASVDRTSLGEPFVTSTAAFPCRARSVTLGECPCGVVLETGTRLDSVEATHRQTSCSLAGASSVLPLRTRGELLGVLVVTPGSGQPLDKDARRALIAVADQLAIAIENAELVAQLSAIGAERELRRMRAELISSVSHELRTPLGFVKSYATTLLRDAGTIDDETRRQFLEVIDEETGKLERMIEELLDVSRMQTGRLPVEPESVMIGALVDRAVETMRPALTDTGHTVVLRLPDPDLEVFVDPLRMEQVLDNLLQNAVRYSTAATEIEIDVVSDNDAVLLAVRDHGEGVRDEDHERIFEPFYRGKAGGPGGARGIGLGLAICRGLVEAQGGTIWVENATGGGAVFNVTLPFSTEKIGPTATSKRSRHSSSKSP